MFFFLCRITKSISLSCIKFFMLRHPEFVPSLFPFFCSSTTLLSHKSEHWALMRLPECQTGLRVWVLAQTRDRGTSVPILRFSPRFLSFHLYSRLQENKTSHGNLFAIILVMFEWVSPFSQWASCKLYREVVCSNWGKKLYCRIVLIGSPFKGRLQFFLSIEFYFCLDIF